MTAAALQFRIKATRTDLGLGQDVASLIRLESPQEMIKDTRGAAVWVHVFSNHDRAVLKTYQHRGMLSRFGGRLGQFRAEREFNRLCILFDAGVRCCEPLFWGLGSGRDRGLFEVIGTREIPHSVQLKAYLRDCRRDGGNPDLAPLFDTIRELHRAGLYHGSLTPNNIVASVPPEGHVEYYVVDLPRAIDFPYDIAPTVMGVYDIVHFIYRTRPEAGTEPCLSILDFYGFPPKTRQRIEKLLADYQPGKLLRQKLKHQFGTRARLDRMLGRSRGLVYLEAPTPYSDT